MTEMNACVAKGLDAIRHALRHHADLNPPDYIELARLAGEILDFLSSTPDSAEWYTNVVLSAPAFGQLLMENIDPDRLGHKRFWFEVAEHIGPDYAQGLYHAAVFTTKVA